MASAIWKLIPVVILLAVVVGGAYVAYQMYLYSQELANRGQKHLEKRHIHFTKDGGMKVGVRELKTEEYSDRTQNMLVKAWNLSTWPAYKSWMWPQATPTPAQSSPASAKKTR